MNLRIGLLLLFAVFLNNNTKAQGIEDDKLWHAGIGFGISAVVYTSVKARTGNKKKALLFGMLTASVAGLTKELFDEGRDNNSFDATDALGTTVGGALGGLTMHFILDKKKKKPKEVDEAELQRELFFAIEASN